MTHKKCMDFYHELYAENNILGVDLDLALQERKILSSIFSQVIKYVFRSQAPDIIYSFQICLGYEKYITPGALVSDLRRNS